MRPLWRVGGVGFLATRAFSRFRRAAAEAAAASAAARRCGLSGPSESPSELSTALFRSMFSSRCLS